MISQSEAKRADRNEDEGGRKTFERRGLFAAAWAAVAALVLTRTTQPVEATAGQQFQDTSGGGFINNSAGGPSALFSNSAYTSTSSTFVGYAFQGTATAGLAGINGSGSAIAPVPTGVYGAVNKASTGQSIGVLGDNTNATGIGVLGRSGSDGALRDGIGVQGESSGGTGVMGVINSGAKNASAVLAVNFSGYAGPGPGGGGVGVYAFSQNGPGVLGVTGTPGGSGLIGATNGLAGAYAAVMYGPLLVTGTLTVFGAKSAAVPHPDGSHRRLYCVESPESWFEDFGKGQLDCGRAEVTLDPNFSALADTNDYHVFVSVYEQHNDLMVSDRTARGFRVEAKDGGSNGEFSWRVVAKRKDIAGERLAVVPLPPPEPTVRIPQTAQAGSVTPVNPNLRRPQ